MSQAQQNKCRRARPGRSTWTRVAVALAALAWAPAASAQTNDPRDEGEPDTAPTIAPGAEQEDSNSDSESPEDLGQSEVIVITGSRYERPLDSTPVATEVITRDAIEESGAENVAELLEEHPGIDISPTFRGSSIRMQGLGPEYVLVLVDGERAIGRIGGALDLERFPIETIERVEIVKGASSALYGSEALAGVVNIITRDNKAPVEVELHSAYGRFNTADLSGAVGVRRGRVGTRFTAGWHRSDGYDLTPTDIATTASAFDQFQVANRTTLDLGERLRLVGKADYLRRDQQGVDASATGAVFDRQTLTEVSTASVRGEWRPRPRGSRLTTVGSFSLYRDQFLSDQRNSDALDRFEITTEQLAELEAQYEHAIGGHYVTAGVEGIAQFLESPRLSDDGSRYRVAVFGQDEWSRSNVTLAPGARLDVDSQFGTQLSPKLTARWDVHPTLVARANYGWGFRAPGFRELLLRFENPGAGYRVRGNPDLEPERSRNLNIGLEWQPMPRFWMAVNGFHNDIDDLIVTNVVDDMDAGGLEVFEYQNVASARTTGVEALARVRPIDPLTFEVGYVLTDTLDRENDRPLPGRALHRGTFKVKYVHTGSNSRAVVRGRVYGTRRFFVGDEEQPADPYAAVDARVETEVGMGVSVFAGVDNALDAGDPELLPIPPRSFYGGLTARYR